MDIILSDYLPFYYFSLKRRCNIPLFINTHFLRTLSLSCLCILLSYLSGSDRAIVLMDADFDELSLHTVLPTGGAQGETSTIVQECCYKTCSLRYLQSFCANTQPLVSSVALVSWFHGF